MFKQGLYLLDLGLTDIKVFLNLGLKNFGIRDKNRYFFYLIRNTAYGTSGHIFLCFGANVAH